MIEQKRTLTDYFNSVTGDELEALSDGQNRVARLGVKSLDYYKKVGATDYADAFALAMQDLGNSLYIGPGVYNTTAPVAFVGSKSITTNIGASVVAQFSGEAFITIDGGGTRISYCEITGYGLWDGNTTVDVGIEAPDAHRCVIDGPRISNVNQKGVVLGRASGEGRHGCRVGNLEIRATPGHGYDAANLSIGVEAKTVFSDSYFYNMELIGFNVGLKNSGGTNTFTGIHPWTTWNLAPMKYALWTMTPCSFSQCYADSPTSLGDPFVGPVYGFYIDSFSVDLLSPIAFLLATDSGHPVGINNEATAIYFNQTGVDGCFCSVFGGKTNSSSSSVKWSKDVDSSNWLNAQNTFALVGFNPGPNVISPQGGFGSISQLKSNSLLNINPASTASSHRSGLNLNVTSTIATLPLASANINVIRVVTDGVSNQRLVISDGTIWRYVSGAAV